MKRQREIPGTERQAIPELDEAVEVMIGAEIEKKRVTRAAVEAGCAVQVQLAANGLDVYEYQDGEFRCVVTREAIEKAKITQLRWLKPQDDDRALA